MSAFKRRRPEPEAVAPEPEIETSPASATITPAMPTEIALPAHVQRSLIVLTTKLQHAMERIEQLETRIEDLNDQVINTPSHSDVLEVRMHGAKLAAELARTTVELRGEIGMASDEARRAARAARTAAVADVEAAALEAAKLDLIAHEEAEPQVARPTPWSQTA